MWRRGILGTMADRAAVIFEDQLRVPAGLDSLDRFREWAHSGDFPEDGRIDFLDGEIEIDMSPEDLFTHGIVKSAIAGSLHEVVTVGERGYLFIDRTRVCSPAAGLSAEPDIVVVLWESLDSGRARLVPARSRKPGRFVELEGAPDLVVEIVSDSSEHKDFERLPLLYERAGVPEMWTVDARGQDLLFELRRLGTRGYEVAVKDAGDWSRSSALDIRVRLRRRQQRDRWRYTLEIG